MYPTNNKIYVPTTPQQRDITIEEVREHGKVIVLSPDGTRGTVQVKIEGTVVYCGCYISPNGMIEGFIRGPENLPRGAYPSPDRVTYPTETPPE